MKRVGGRGKSGEGVAEKEENLGEKLRRGVVLVGKRGGPCTPVVSSWRLFSLSGSQAIINKQHPSSSFSLSQPQPPITTTTASVSVRKLAAALWELQHYFPLAKMHRGAHSNGAPPPPRLRHLHHPHHRLHKDKATLDLSNFLADNSPSSPDQVGIT